MHTIPFRERKFHESDTLLRCHRSGFYAGVVLTSNDGVTWKIHQSGTDERLQMVVFDRGTFVAIGWKGVILISPNGTRWSGRPQSDNFPGLEAPLRLCVKSHQPQVRLRLSYRNLALVNGEQGCPPQKWKAMSSKNKTKGTK